jgi:FkbM family methyltransferase
MRRQPIRKLISTQTHRFVIRGFERARNKGAIKKATLFFGDNMDVVLPEVISEAIYTYGFFDEVVTGLVVENVRPGEVVFDIGAHYGYFSLLLAHLVGERGRVYAVEPTPSTFDILQRNASKRANITCLNVAAGDKLDTCEIKDYGVRYCAWNTLATTSRMPTVLNQHTPKQVRVGMIKLDAYISDHNLKPKLIKIDAENYEAQIVKGLEDTLERTRPKVILEMGSANSLTAARYLLSHGYELFVSNKLGSIVPFDGRLDEANRYYKDGLFLPSSSR